MWTKVLDSAPKQGTMSKFEIDGKKLFISYDNSKLYCGENRCPHEDIELTLGCLKDGRIVCSLHGFSFDLATGESSDIDVDNMQVFPVEKRDDGIYIKV